MTFSVVLDACVLVPHPLYDTLLRLADAGLFRPLWSDQILVEVERTLVGKLGLPAAKARRRIDQMRRAFPDALVEGYEGLVPAMTNDHKDRHVLAAAVRSGASIIVTANLKDFPVSSLESYEIEALHPDHFLLDQLDLDARAVMGCLREQRASYTEPTMSSPVFYQYFWATVPTFAQTAESLERGQESARLAARSTWPAPADMPLPLEARDDEEAFTAFFPDGEPDPRTPLGAAFLWWSALGDMDEAQTDLEELTWNVTAWEGFTLAKGELEGWAMAQMVQHEAEHPDLVAYVKLIPSPGTSARVFATAMVPDVQVLTLIRDNDGTWKVWGLSRNRFPTYGEIVGTQDG